MRLSRDLTEPLVDAVVESGLSVDAVGEEPVAARAWRGCSSTGRASATSSGSVRPTPTRGSPTRSRPRCRGSRPRPRSRWSSARGTCPARASSTPSPSWTGCARPVAAPGTRSRPTSRWRSTSPRRPRRRSRRSSRATGSTSPRRLGDVLLQVLFHARVAEDASEADERFDIDDVAGGLVAKARPAPPARLRRRRRLHTRGGRGGLGADQGAGEGRQVGSLNPFPRPSSCATVW